MSNLAHISDHERFEGQAAQEAPRGPQLEEGYTQLANRLFEEVMAAPLTLREMRVVLAVIRLTYGWNRKQARVTGGLLAKLTGMPTTKVSQTLAGLVAKNVITRHGGSRSPVSLNKHVDQWCIEEPQRTTPPPKKKGEIYQSGGTHPKRYESHQNGKSECYQNGNASKDMKDNLEPKGSKDTSRKKSPVRKWGDEIDYELVTEMVAAVSADLDSPVKHNSTTWANEFRLMRERDGRTVEQIRYLITWTAKHEFWGGVVLSPAKLRDKWDQLDKQVKAQKKPKGSSGRHTGLQAPSTDGLIDKGDGTYEF